MATGIVVPGPYHAMAEAMAKARPPAEPYPQTLACLVCDVRWRALPGDVCWCCGAPGQTNGAPLRMASPHTVTADSEEPSR